MRYFKIHRRLILRHYRRLSDLKCGLRRKLLSIIRGYPSNVRVEQSGSRVLPSPETSTGEIVVRSRKSVESGSIFLEIITARGRRYEKFQ